MSNEDILSFKKCVKKSIKSTLENSSLHAVPNIVRTDYISIKILWFLCFILSAGGCSFFMSKSILEYSEWPVVTNIKIKHLTKVLFPIVTNCNPNMYKSNSKMVIDCTFNWLKCSHEDDFEEITDPIYGKCFRFNSGRSMNGSQIPLKYISGKGTPVLNSFELILTTGNDETFAFTGKNGLVFFISDEAVNSLDEYGIELSSGYSHNIKLSKFRTIKQPKPYSQCLQDLNSLDSYDSEFYRKTIEKNSNLSYKYTNCRNMCLQKFLGNTCKFQTNMFGPSYYDNMSIVAPLDFSNPKKRKCIIKILNTVANSTDSDYIKNCDCPLKCETKTYTYVTTSIDWPLRSYYELLSSSEPEYNQTFPTFSEQKEKGMYVSLFFDEMTETIIKEEPKYQLSELIANLGGLVGLFTGFSFLTFVELAEITAKVSFIFYEYKRDKRMKTFYQQEENGKMSYNKNVEFSVAYELSTLV